MCKCYNRKFKIPTVKKSPSLFRNAGCSYQQHGSAGNKMLLDTTILLVQSCYRMLLNTSTTILLFQSSYKKPVISWVWNVVCLLCLFLLHYQHLVIRFFCIPISHSKFTTNSHFYYKDTLFDKKKYKYIEDFLYIIELCLLIGIFIIITMNFFKKKTRSLISSRFFKLEKCK